MEPQHGLSQAIGTQSQPRIGLSGCRHYKRSCKIVAPCCKEIFGCVRCHDEFKNSMQVNPDDWHDIPRDELKRVICSFCDTEQDVQQMCINCGGCMGKYFCSKCKLFDDNEELKRFHCDECGVCRSGGRENFIHCEKCGCCYLTRLKDTHICMENAMRVNCPVCQENLFDSQKTISLLKCGHNIHQGCLAEMRQRYKYKCAVCSKAFCNMTNDWRRLDMAIASTPMPGAYRNLKVSILCNECLGTSEVSFHVLGLKCPLCKSYNTKRT